VREPASSPGTIAAVKALCVGVALLAAAAICVAAAGAAGTAGSASAAPDSAFCQKAKLIFGKGTDLLTLPPATIKADDAVFKADQPSVTALAPSSLRSDLKQIFTFDNGLFTDLSKVGWTVAKLPRPVLQQLAVTGPKLKPASDKVIGYLDTACGFKLPKP
jgi:hypothetical protein